MHGTHVQMSQICIEKKSRESGGRGGQRPPEETASGNERERWKPAQWGWDSLLLRIRAPLEGIVALRITSIHLWPQTQLLYINIQSFSSGLNLIWWVLQTSRTSQRCIRSPIGSSRRETWNAVWRRSLCGCFQTLRGRWLSNPAEAGWPEGNRPEVKGKIQTWCWNAPPSGDVYEGFQVETCHHIVEKHYTLRPKVMVANKVCDCS